ncbi:MAG: AbrB/MazE/SpoVT family DNA-binding domain-containing protein [Rhizobacter sp.]|nr:AbrB/MazE/SpoVT family DNA-binding domain-containing protein [Chlorobiales bacterium]
MQTKVQQWGNSLAVRIPQSLAKDSELTQGKAVDLVLEHGHIVIKPVGKRKFKLDQLLTKINRRNLHKPQGFETATGREWQ